MTGSFLPDGAFRSEICFDADDTDRFGRVEGSALLWQMQEIAGAHYEALGYGAALVRSHGCFWAVIRSEGEISVSPVPGEKLWLDTWTGRSAHGLYRRHYLMQRPDGTELARSVAVWVLMDIAERQLAADRSWLPDPQTVTRQGELSLARREPFPEPSGSAVRTVADSETDVNGHLNNTIYLRWAADLLPEEFIAARALRAFRVEYKKELTSGESAVLS